ncbi:hypothetical protein VDQ57_000690 [Xanthomonas campestris pv. campestris]|nr:hypothetical protein VDQ57_000690 [Xanthomonas campestris pv. campestris]
MNSSVYRLLLIDTSESTIFHGLEMSRKPWAYHISAKVQLHRIQQGRSVKVALRRSQWVSRSEVEWLTVSPDGVVPGLEAADADRESLLKAGLIAQDVAYRELSFASADALPPGHYVLGLTLGNERKLLIDAKAKLLIAYRARKK